MRETSSRRCFLESAALGAGLLAPGRPASAAAPAPARPPLLKPRRLQPGDTVGLVSPSRAAFLSEDLEIAIELLAAFGLKARPGRHALARYGYLGGRDEERASDLNELFAAQDVRGILAVNGGWGAARLLPRLDYDTIRRNPKALIGYSDITALHAGIGARTGLVTFHAPFGRSRWPAFAANYFKRVVLEGELVAMTPPTDPGDSLVMMEDRIRTITPGTARGRLLGGNLTVLSALVGSGYLPAFEGAILVLEDVDEELYRVDRMFTQLELCGVLAKVAGVVFGKCTRCEPGEGYGSNTLEEILDDHVKGLGVPAFSGAMIGHVSKQFTLPLGIEVELDASAGIIRMLEPAVA
jgi:muramoyltetrapeptide carboxypeptidase